MSYERQPPGLTLLTLLSVPASGGDTAWVSQVAAYERLSDPIKRLLERLEAEHDGFRQAENARRDGKFVRREPVKNNHPIVRVHPVSSSLSTHRSVIMMAVCSGIWLTLLGDRRKSPVHQPRLHTPHHRLERRRVRRASPALVQGTTQNPVRDSKTLTIAPIIAYLHFG